MIMPRADTEGAPSAMSDDGAGEVTVTQTAHGYEVGDKVTVSGANEARFNGTHTVTVVNDANTWRFAPASTSAGAATGTFAAVVEAFGILEANAEEGADYTPLSGVGVIKGGGFYENLLPDATGTPAELPAAYKTELSARFYFEQYADSRLA